MLPTIIPIFGFGPVTSLGPIDAMYNEIIYSSHIPAGDPVEVVADGVGAGTCEVVAVDVAIEVKEVAVTMTTVDINAGDEARESFIKVKHIYCIFSRLNNLLYSSFLCHCIILFSLIISTE